MSTPSKASASTEPEPTQPTRRRAPVTATRDPARTRARILAVATAEFSSKGYSGARTEQIARRAKTNIRMLYHYFGNKETLYVSVLEEVLAQLRREELQLDFDDATPLQGVLQMFDFIDAHFSARPALRNLLAFENLNRGRHLKQSTRIQAMASPVIALVDKLLRRGEADGSFPAGLDALHLYVAMVSLVYYSRSHAHTLSQIFATDLLASDWQAAHRAQTHRMLTSYLTNRGSAPGAAPVTSPPKTRRKSLASAA